MDTAWGRPLGLGRGPPETAKCHRRRRVARARSNRNAVRGTRERMSAARTAMGHPRRRNWAWVPGPSAESPSKIIRS